jgi:hypothetical protein
MCCVSDSAADFQASRLSCPPFRSTQTECNCGGILICLQCHLRFVGTVQSAILFACVTFPVRRSPSTVRPSEAGFTES